MPTIKQRVALLRAHNWVCPYCQKTIDSLSNSEIDHIIPKSYGNNPSMLRELLNRIGMPDLVLDSYRNWFPIHGEPCNRIKGKVLLPDHSLVMQLEIARQKEPRVLEEEQRFDRQLRSRDALAAFVRLIEPGEFSKDEAIAYIQNAQVATQKRSDPMVLSFSVNVVELMASHNCPQDAGEGEKLYEYLEKSLMSALDDSGAVFVSVGASERNGETISIRYAFWLLDLESLPGKFPFNWELLQVAPYSEVFPGQDPEDLFKKAIILKRNKLIINWNSDDPLAYNFCPQCGSSQLHRSSHSMPDDTVYYIRCDCGWVESF
jgi:hypothetical protein